MPSSERVSFEAWYRHTFDDAKLQQNVTYPHHYIDPQTQQAWRAWKAQEKRYSTLVTLAKEIAEPVYLASLTQNMQKLIYEIAKLKENP